MKTRTRLVDTAADMLCRKGLNATSIRELAKEAKAPLGSTYHYFPGGKPQVVAEAVEYAGEKVSDQLESALIAGPRKGIEQFIGRWRDIIIRSEFRAGCTVLAASIEEPLSKETEIAADAAKKVYKQWRDLLENSFLENGVPENNARELATTVVAATEGAVVMCRASRSITPLDEVAGMLYSLLDVYLLPAQ